MAEQNEVVDTNRAPLRSGAGPDYEFSEAQRSSPLNSVAELGRRHLRPVRDGVDQLLPRCGTEEKHSASIKSVLVFRRGQQVDMPWPVWIILGVRP